MNNSNTITVHIHRLLPLLIIGIFPIYGFNILHLTKEVYQANCSISGATLYNYYNIKCPIKDFKLELIMESSNQISLICFNINYTKFQNILPKLTIGVRKIVEIKNCPLPENKSISTILQQLGLLDVKSLIFKNNKLDTTLYKIHLSELLDLTNLTLKLHRTTTIPYDVFGDISLKSLKSLELYSNISTLPYGIISNLEHIEVLSLQGNLHSLTNDLLDFRTQLVELNLSNNKLKNLTKEFFKYTVNLQVLNLQNNLIDLLDKHNFAYLPNLRQLDLSGNKFSELPEGLLRNNRKLEKFILSHNEVALKNLPTNFLADLPDLSEIILQCGLETVQRNLFENSNNIKILEMSGNKFKELPEELFNTHINIQHLKLDNNDLHELPQNIFQNTTHLKVLTVSHNKLTRFSR